MQCQHHLCSIRGLTKFTVQKIQPIPTEASGAGSRNCRVETDQPQLRSFDGELNKTVCVCCDRRNHLQQAFAVIVVAHHQVNRQVQPRQRFLEGVVSPHLPVMGQVSCDQHKFGIAMLVPDVPDCCVQPCPGISPKQGFAMRHKMGVGKDDEFHGGRMNFRGADEPQPPNPTGSSRLFPALQFV